MQPHLASALSLATVAALGCAGPVDVLLDGPKASGPVPSSQQLAYQRNELIGFLHFGLETYDSTEHGDPAQDSPNIFNPTDVDAAQWVQAFKDAGFGQVTLVAKHDPGFCLWPSKLTKYSATAEYQDYTVQSSPWQNGRGDVVGSFTKAAHDLDMRVGLYLSPWDVNFPSTDTADYQAYFEGQLTELLQNYGRVDEILFDGFSAPTALDWQAIAKLAHRLQPEVLVWMGKEIFTADANLQYVGNEYGQGSTTTSSVVESANGDGGPANIWCPSEAPVSDRSSNPSNWFAGQDWFWHASDTVMPLSQMQTVYFGTVGRNATLNFDVPPSSSGLQADSDQELLQQFGSWYRSLYASDLVQGQRASADSIWANPGFGPSKAVDGNLATYWVAAEGTTSAYLEVDPASPITFDLISIREPIELGERVTAYHIELSQNGVWNTAPVDASGTQIQGTVIGQRQLWQLDETEADAIKLVIDSATDTPAIAELGVYSKRAVSEPPALDAGQGG